ncbi:MAG: winged helix-turn-helix transcriptional regulator [bacterium]
MKKEPIPVGMDENEYRASRLHLILGSLIRYRIYKLIGEEYGIDTSELADRTKRSLSTISYHIDKLKELDLINTKKEGLKSHHYIKREDIYYQVLAIEKIFDR